MNLVQWALTEKGNENRHLLESLLSLYLKSSEVKMRDLICKFDDFQNSFKYISEEMNQFMVNVFTDNEMTRNFKFMMWRSELD